MLKLHQQAEAMLAPWGAAPAAPAEGAPSDAAPPSVEIVQTFGELELEYAAVRKTCGLFDSPHRSVLEITGAERLGFLNRMLTQELKGLRPRELRKSFWLNRKGRIDADLRLFETGASILVDLDVTAAKRAVDGLNAFIIADDVAVADISADWCRIALHGPTGPTLLDELAEPAEALPPASKLAQGDATRVLFELGPAPVPDQDDEAQTPEPASVWVVRDDATGDPGLELFVPAHAAYAVYRRLLEAGSDPGLTIDGSRPTLGHRVRLRPIGWHAFNIARIEAGTPIFNIDFSDENLPAEAGLIDQRVSFTKGCYLGQEIVARMHARGHPRQTLAALRIEPPAEARDKDTGLSFMPVSGGAVYRMPEGGLAAFRADQAEQVGTITSSTLAPMLAANPVCFAQMKWDHHHPGARHVVLAEGVPSLATVQPKLAFWSRA